MKAFIQRLIILALGILTAVLPSQAQVSSGILWDKNFGGSNDDILFALQPAHDGGYLLGGHSLSAASGNKTNVSFGGYDYWVIKIDTNGNKAWEKIFGGSSGESLYAVQQTSDGGYVLGGNSASDVSGNKTDVKFGIFDFWIVKIDAAGNKTWDKSFGGSSSDELRCLLETSDGGYILGGASLSPVSGNKTGTWFGSYDYWVVKIDAYGTKAWDKTFGGSGSDSLLSIQQTSDGGYILVGSSQSTISGNKSSASFGSYDIWVVKIDSVGNKVWEKSFGGSGDDMFGGCLQQTSDGGYILGGRSSSGTSGNKSATSFGANDGWVIKIDAVGNRLWDKSFGGLAEDQFSSLQATSDGDYVLGGYSSSGISGNKSHASFGSNDFWIVKINALGIKIWEKGFGGLNDDFLSTLRPTSDGNYILGGRSLSGISGNKNSGNSGGWDYWVIKVEDVPSLNVNHSGNGLILSWPKSFGTFQLESSTNFFLPLTWTVFTHARTTNAGTISVNIPVSSGMQFFRLAK